MTLAGTLAGCELEEVAIPKTEPKIALHGVLSASAPSQVVMLERTRSGLVFLFAPEFDLADPVVSDEGIAESGAIVQLTAPDGQSFFAREDNTIRDDRKGEGIYRFSIPGSTLQRGGEYVLSVRTAAGKELSARTTMPSGTPALDASSRRFNRAADTVVVQWPATAGARTYFVRIETPFGPRSFFTDSTHVRLTGDLRNAEIQVLPRVFIPGFQQAVTVSAVDSNFYDWVRTQNNALSGLGLINRVNGGVGVFGSLVRLRFEDFRVVAPQTEPAAGLWEFAGTGQQRETTPYFNFELYVESKSARSDQPDALSGRFERRLGFGQPPEPFDGILGTVRDGRVVLNMLRGWTSRDTVEVFTGDLRGDTLTGTYRGFGGFVKFVKRR